MKHWRFTGGIRGNIASLLVVAWLAPLTLFGSHFRFGTVNWKPTGDPNEVEFRFIAGFQRDVFAGFNANPIPGGPPIPRNETRPGMPPITGDIIAELVGSEFSTFEFGDGQVANLPNPMVPGSNLPLRYRVVSFSSLDNIFTAEALQPGTDIANIRHVYAGPGPFLAGLSECCRAIASLIVPGSESLNNRGDGLGSGGYNVQALVFPQSGNSSPVIDFFNLIKVRSAPDVSFFIPARDPDGDRLRWRFGTNEEAGGDNANPLDDIPPNMAINPDTGEITWNTVGLDTTSRWTVQVIVEDLDSMGMVKSRTPIDFLLKISPSMGPPPDCEIVSPGPFIVRVGNQVSFNVTATHPDPAMQIELNTGGIPAGATMSSPLPLQGTTPLQSAFQWTPGTNQVGTFVVVFSVNAADELQEICSVQITVLPPSPFDIFAGNIVLNPQTGLFEQTIIVTNISLSAVPGVQLLLQNLPARVEVFNATGTNNPPFLQFNQPLEPGATVRFVAEYYDPSRRFGNAEAPTLEAVVRDPAPPAAPPGTILAIDRCLVLPDGRLMIEWTSIPGRNYAVQFSEDMVVWKTASPVVRAIANRFQWLDDGPPKTDPPPPAAKGVRFYRIILLP